MEESLRVVAREGDINKLYELLGLDPKLLERIDEIPFENTPLHIAAATGCTHFAIEIMRLKPSLAKKLNPDGRSPLDLALQHDHVETVRRMVKFDGELIRVQGREGFTPLHYVVKKDDIDLLAEFLLACPPSIQDLTIRGETAVHIAAKNGKVRALKVLLGWLQRTNNKDLLNTEDEEGNTALHLAASNNEPQVLRLLANKIRKSQKNSKGLTARDVVLQLPKDQNTQEAMKVLGHSPGFCGRFRPLGQKNLAQFLSSREGPFQKIIKFEISLQRGLSTETKNMLLVVAVLIATAAYQAALTPPKGPYEDLEAKGLNITSEDIYTSQIYLPDLYHRYLNSFGFATSTAIILYLLPTGIHGSMVRSSLILLVIGYLILAIFFNGFEENRSPYIVWVVSIYGGFYGRICIEFFLSLIPWLPYRSRFQMQRQVVESKYSWQDANKKARII